MQVAKGEQPSDNAMTGGHAYGTRRNRLCYHARKSVAEGDVNVRVFKALLLCKECDKITGGVCKRRLALAKDAHYDHFKEEKWDADKGTTFGILKAHELH